jgi:hypothetical protein
MLPSGITEWPEGWVWRPARKVGFGNGVTGLRSQGRSKNDKRRQGTIYGKRDINGVGRRVDAAGVI